jgi:hypothetical protein
VGTVIIREFNDMARPRAGGGDGATGLVGGVLLSDEYGFAIKTVTTVMGTAVDSERMSAKTHFVALEASANCRYAIRPKDKVTEVPATAQHNPLPANTVVVEKVYPGAIISFLES